MGNLYIAALIDGQQVAIPIESVNSAIRISAPVPVPSACSAVAGLVALRSRVLTLIDCAYQLGAEPRRPQAGDYAIVIAVAGHDYGLLVDEIFDVLELDADRINDSCLLMGSWKVAGLGIAEYRGESMVVLDPAPLVLPDMRVAA